MKNKRISKWIAAAGFVTIGFAVAVFMATSVIKANGHNRALGVDEKNKAELANNSILGGEVELNNQANESVGAQDTSKWDMTKVNAVADTEGEYVPVPKGFVASGATGEHTVKTGFVIYEGDEPVDDTNAWDESCTRNQFVWVPVADWARVFEEIGQTGKKKGKLWEYNSTGKSAINNGDTDTRREPGILTSYDTKDRKSVV